MVSLDQKDLKILYYLKINSRVSLTELGQLVDLSPAGVTLRINKLVENKVIDRFTIRVNYDKLAPNSLRYLFQASTSSSDTNMVLEKLQATRFFDTLFLVGASMNLYGVTLPIFQKDLQSLFQLVNTLPLNSYTFLPILHDYEGSPEFDVTAENVTSLYCPLCQKSLSGEAIVTKIGSQLLAFCCRDCKEEFEAQYEALTKAET